MQFIPFDLPANIDGYEAVGLQRRTAEKVFAVRPTNDLNSFVKQDVSDEGIDVVGTKSCERGIDNRTMVLVIAGVRKKDRFRPASTKDFLELSNQSIHTVTVYYIFQID